MSIHKSLTIERVELAAHDCMFGMANTGFCEACGEEREGCEPDAHNYECYECGEYQVTGAPDLLMVLV